MARIPEPHSGDVGPIPTRRANEDRSRARTAVSKTADAGSIPALRANLCKYHLTMPVWRNWRNAGDSKSPTHAVNTAGSNPVAGTTILTLNRTNFHNLLLSAV